LEVSEGDELRELMGIKSRMLVLFLASWCPFCRAFKPTFEKETTNSKEFIPAMAFLDEEDNPMWEEYGIRTTPTVIYFKNGQALQRLDGVAGEGLDRAKLLNFLRTLR